MKVQDEAVEQGEGKMTDHDLLVCIDVKLKELKEQFSNHLKHHWAMTLALVMITFGSVISVIIALLTR